MRVVFLKNLPFSRITYRFLKHKYVVRFIFIYVLYKIYLFHKDTDYVYKYKQYRHLLLWMNTPNSSKLVDQVVLDCDDLYADAEYANNRSENVHYYYHSWWYDKQKILRNLFMADNRCDYILDKWHWNSAPLSEEEQNYPLAYGLIVYKDIVQVLFMLSTFYHPQNVYCIAVEETASIEFMSVIDELPSCLENVYVVKTLHNAWGEYEILDSVIQCTNLTSHLDIPWKYYQYLSGVDLPLKTNLEMVRIFKALNESVNFTYDFFENYRFMKKRKIPSPAPLWKASLSALIPRKSIDAMVRHPKVHALLHYLNGTMIPDESFWGTVFGNPGILDLPGSVSVHQLKELSIPGILKQYNITSIDSAEFESIPKNKIYCENFEAPCFHNIARYQVWEMYRQLCKGWMINRSCVYGVLDLPILLKRYELVAHKIYMDYQPAAYFCLIKEIKKREKTPVDTLDLAYYRELPQVKVQSGLVPKTHNATFYKDWYSRIQNSSYVVLDYFDNEI